MDSEKLILVSGSLSCREKEYMNSEKFTSDLFRIPRLVVLDHYWNCRLLSAGQMQSCFQTSNESKVTTFQRLRLEEDDFGRIFCDRKFRLTQKNSISD